MPVDIKRRVECKTVKQIPSKPFDERLLRRAKMLPSKQQDAIRALHALRQKLFFPRIRRC
ncbi:hypothetical protein FRUB_06702 [Fimbriiglobus ruber]|uniref:Uncharacterized protein n=1 Tax=Fimbriiglobus ruber TaxID=1908690 RepID=A0A225D801_9BACT|nr:hypothetical protein FRUB_06702 [Fimbriiglobus ruber]